MDTRLSVATRIEPLKVNEYWPYWMAKVILEMFIVENRGWASIVCCTMVLGVMPGWSAIGATMFFLLLQLGVRMTAMIAMAAIKYDLKWAMVFLTNA